MAKIFFLSLEMAARGDYLVRDNRLVFWFPLNREWNRKKRMSDQNLATWQRFSVYIQEVHW